METKKMKKDGFIKKQVVVVIEKDRTGKEHFTVVDTMEHAKWYTCGEIRQATMYIKED